MRSRAASGLDADAWARLGGVRGRRRARVHPGAAVARDAPQVAQHAQRVLHELHAALLAQIQEVYGQLDDAVAALARDVQRLDIEGEVVEAQAREDIARHVATE